MKVLVMWEWDNSKDVERLKKYYEYAQTYVEYVSGVDKGICKRSTWVDGTGHHFQTLEFESMEDYTKVWSDDEYFSRFVRFCRLVDNARTHVLRPAVGVPP
jgi:hypothetical protein